MTIALYLLAIQGLLGGFDTVFYHEWKAHLPLNVAARRELFLHGLRSLIYGVLFGSLGWISWNGALAWLLAIMLLAEIAVTLSDFAEEDRIRKLPAGEWLTHAIMGILYGGFLANFLPVLIAWASLPTGVTVAPNHPIAWVLSAMAIGVVLSGLRDLWCGHRLCSAAPHTPDDIRRDKVTDG
jgi:hypothetical protein